MGHSPASIIFQSKVYKSFVLAQLSACHTFLVFYQGGSRDFFAFYVLATM